MAKDTGDQTDWAILSVKIPEEEKDLLKENTDTLSGKVRDIVEELNDIEEEQQIRDSTKQTTLAILRSYRNSFEKNIEAMESQKQKLDEQIERIENEDDEEVLFEVELDIDDKKL